LYALAADKPWYFKAPEKRKHDDTNKHKYDEHTHPAMLECNLAMGGLSVHPLRP